MTSAEFAALPGFESADGELTVEDMDDDTGVSAGDLGDTDGGGESAGFGDQLGANVGSVGVGVSKLLGRAAAAKEVSAQQLAAAARANAVGGLGSSMMIDRAHTRFMHSVGRRRWDDRMVGDVDDAGGGFE